MNNVSCLARSYHSLYNSATIRLKAVPNTTREESVQFVGAKLIREDGRVIMDNSFSDRLFSIRCPWPSSLLIRNVSFS